MKNVEIKNPILESVYNYYTNANNYLNESLTEEGHCITVDDRLFNDLMDMITLFLLKNKFRYSK